jgi:hypothetical protein
MAGEREEQFILRVQDAALADRIRGILREDPAAAPADAKLEIHFDGVAFCAALTEFWSGIACPPAD